MEIQKSQYKSLSEWIKADFDAYKRAIKLNELPKICEAFGWRIRKKWTKELCKEDALKYTRKSDWEKNSTGYQAAKKRNCVDECCQHMEGNKDWTKELCKEDALKYNTPKEWMKNGSGYVIARINGWLEECCAHMNYRKPPGYWTLERCKEDASNYSSRIGWYNGKNNGYGAAQKNGWLDECCAHM